MDLLDLSHNGGHPHTMNDLDFIQFALRDAIKGHLSGITEDPSLVVIISGINLTNTGGANWAWQDGFILMGGDIWRVAAGTITVTAGNVLTWAIDTLYDPNGDDTYEDGNFYQVYELNRGAISQAPSTPYTAPEATPNYKQVVNSSDDIWHEVGAIGEPAFDSHFSNLTISRKVAFRKNADGSVSLKGVAHGVGFNYFNPIFILPVGYRPAEDFETVVTNSGIYPATIMGLAINATGEVIVKVTGSVSDDISLYGVTIQI